MSRVGPFEIFKIRENGDSVWCEAAQDLEGATARVAVLQQESPGEYMVYSQSTGKRIVFTARGGVKRD